MTRTKTIALIVVVAIVVGGIFTASWALQRVKAGIPLFGKDEVPSAYASMVVKASKRCPQIPLNVFAAQLATESDWNPKAQSGAGAQGIAQFMPGTWEEYGIDASGDDRADVWNPADAIASAAELNCAIWDLVAKVPGDHVTNTLAAYNAGFDVVRKYGGVPPFPETQAYVDRIKKRSESIVFP